MIIRSARPDEVDALSQLALRSKAHWGYSEAFMEACRDELTIDAEYLRRNPTHVIEEDGEVIGFSALLHRTEAEVELDFLYIRPESIGCGYGRQLFAHARGFARSLGYGRMTVVVDPHADDFYRQFGGVSAGVRSSGSIEGRELPLLHFELEPEP